MRSALQGVKGVVRADVDWQTGTAKVYHTAELAPEALVRAVEEASRGTVHHYTARVVSSEQQEHQTRIGDICDDNG